jgi:hypothetical protein
MSEPLHIAYQDLQMELRAFIELAGRTFLTPESYDGLLRYRDQLDVLYNGAAKRGFVRWGIPRDQPIRTVSSAGDYDAMRDGRDVHGTMSGRCSIRRVGNMLEFEDSSAQLKIIESLEDGRAELLGAWRFDIGVSTSPGTLFHIKAEGELEFPSNFPVPRLPGLPLTPIAALEYLIGELFQTKWRDHVETDRQAVLAWRAIQKSRLWNYFGYLREAVKEARLTPMILIKEWKPDTSDLFAPKVY